MKDSSWSGNLQHNVSNFYLQIFGDMAIRALYAEDFIDTVYECTKLRKPGFGKADFHYFVPLNWL